MALLPDLLGAGRPQIAFMYPEPDPGIPPLANDIFVFQFFPESVQIDYQPRYREISIPGASHPLYQWSGGSGRSITFQATFTAEIDVGLAALAPAGLSAPGLGGAFTPSERYTVDVRAAMALLQSYMMGDIEEDGVVLAPRRLELYLPNSGLGGGSGDESDDNALVILRSAPYNYEGFFPSGTPRIATVSLQFNEVVQQNVGEGGSGIKYIPASQFREFGKTYRYRNQIAATIPPPGA